MKNKLLLFLMIGMTFMMACNDDDKDEVPPTVNDVIGEYTNDKLKATLDGSPAPENATVQLIQEEGSSTKLVLVNIIPAYPSFEIPNVTYEAVSRSYYSHLNGQVADNISGLNVQVSATIDNGIMEITITTSEITGTPADATSFYDKTFKGNMTISLGEGGSSMEQRVYMLAPGEENTNNLRLRIENFSFEGLTLGNIELDNLPLEQRGDIYGFSAKEQVLEIPGLSEIGISSVKIDAKGAIIDNKTLQLNMVVNASPLTVNVTFTGDTIPGSANWDSYTMTTWVTPDGKNYQEPLYLATSNPAADMFKLASSLVPGLTVEPYPVTQDGDAAKIITRDTKGGYALIAVVPKVTAGTLFNGSFVLNATEPLKSTHFGEPFVNKTAPSSLSFTYKYTPGPNYYKTIISGSGFSTKVTSEEVPGQTDECSIIAYLYEVEDYSEYLDGTNINSSEKVILKAAFYGGNQGEFTEQSVNFEETGNGSFDPSKKYKLAIVCTPSKNGADYEGAPESTLWIKSLKLNY